MSAVVKSFPFVRAALEYQLAEAWPLPKRRQERGACPIVGSEHDEAHKRAILISGSCMPLQQSGRKRARWHYKGIEETLKKAAAS
jgi:hypothetical protein